MIDIEEMKKFIESIYTDHPRGLIHGIEHSERLVKDAVCLGRPYIGLYDDEILELSGLLHGAIHYCEDEIREWLSDQGADDKRVDRIISVAWESQTKSIPVTIEGMILHDAHYVEGGKEFHVLKPFIVGTEMNQPLEKTIEFIKNSTKETPVFYLKESQAVFDEINQYAITFVENIERQMYLE